MGPDGEWPWKISPSPHSRGTQPHLLTQDQIPGTSRPFPTSWRLSLFEEMVEDWGEWVCCRPRDLINPLTYSKLGSETEFHKWENACNLCN